MSESALGAPMKTSFDFNKGQDDFVTLHFTVTRKLYDRVINEGGVVPKTVSYANFLVDAINQDQREAMSDLIEKYPSIEMQLVPELLGAYTPDFKITKK